MVVRSRGIVRRPRCGSFVSLCPVQGSPGRARLYGRRKASGEFTMVTGINKFREYFAGHEDQYAIIGGAACDLLFDAAGIQFRVTKDIDMVLCVEVVDVAFGERFSAFLK